ncbi:MAG TPA: tail fiber protein [Rhodoferax sp.]
MSTPYLGQISIMAFSFAPKGWAQCNGQLLPINQNQALFALLGTYYGGNGQTNFALPDLRGRAGVHVGTAGGVTTVQGEQGGSEAVSLSATELPAHRHDLNTVTDFANSNVPGNALPAARPRGGLAIYGPGGSADTPMNPSSVQTTGSGQPHNNMQPYGVLNFCIALQGIFPSRN